MKKINYEDYAGQKTNYGTISSIWPQQKGYVILNTDEGQFCILESTIQIIDKKDLKKMIVRSDLTGVHIGFYDVSKSSIGDLQYFRVVCRFEGDKSYAEKQATDFITAYNEYFSLMTKEPINL